ncbi:MAG: phage holin family protein [Parcubacteria group bacterium]|nr:phage holin family protein [Parcubacteria group bacterium]
MKNLLLNLLANMFGILIARHFVPGFSFQGDALLLIEGAFILTLINYFLKPILKLVLFPFILLSLGLFTIVINMLLLWIFTQIPLGVQIEGLLALLYATILFSTINFVLHLPVLSSDDTK